MKISLMLSILFSLFPVSGDLSGDSSGLMQAIANADADAALPAVRSLAGYDNEKAVDALSRAYGTASALLEKMQAAPTEESSEKILKLGKICSSIRSALSGMKSRECMDAFLKGVKGRGSPGLRAGMAKALASSENEGIPSQLIRLLPKERSPIVKIAILEGLSRRMPITQKDVAAIAKLLGDDHWQVSAACADCLSALGSLHAVEPLIKALKGAESRMREGINRALVALTGVDKHGDHATWAAWFDRQKKEISEGTYRKPEAPPEGEGGRKRAGTTSFYGIPVTSTNLIFVIDRSSSMNAKMDWEIEDNDNVATGKGVGPNPLQGLKPNGDRRWDIAVYELKKVLLQLPENTKFNIVFYDKGFFELMEDRMIVLRGDTRARALAKLDATDTGNGTNISGGLERAFRLAFPPGTRDLPKDSVDTFYLLSDGNPTRGITDHEELLEWVEEQNTDLKITIHTVSIGKDASLMKKIAEDTGGQYTHR